MTVSVTFSAFGEETLHPIFLRRGFHARILWPVCCDINHVPVGHTGEVNSGHPGPRPSGVPPSSARGFFAPARSWASPLHVCCVGALGCRWLIIRARVCGRIVLRMVGPAGTAIRTASAKHNQTKWRRGTRRSSAPEYNRYRCSLPGLTELTTHRREGTDSGRQGG